MVLNTHQMPACLVIPISLYSSDRQHHPPLTHGCLAVVQEPWVPKNSTKPKLHLQLNSPLGLLGKPSLPACHAIPASHAHRQQQRQGTELELSPSAPAKRQRRLSDSVSAGLLGPAPGPGTAFRAAGAPRHPAAMREDSEGPWRPSLTSPSAGQPGAALPTPQATVPATRPAPGPAPTCSLRPAFPPRAATGGPGGPRSPPLGGGGRADPGDSAPPRLPPCRFRPAAPSSASRARAPWRPPSPQPPPRQGPRSQASPGKLRHQPCVAQARIHLPTPTPRTRTTSNLENSNSPLRDELTPR